MFIETFRCQVLCSVPGPGAAVMKELERTPALVDGACSLIREAEPAPPPPPHPDPRPTPPHPK